MVRILAAAALALTLPITAFAAEHGGGMDQLKAEIMNSTELQGMDIDLDGLTDEQITQISEVLNGDDDRDTKRMKVNEVLGN